MSTISVCNVCGSAKNIVSLEDIKHDMHLCLKCVYTIFWNYFIACTDIVDSNESKGRRIDLLKMIEGLENAPLKKEDLSIKTDHSSEETIADRKIKP